MRSLLTALVAASVIILGAKRAHASVQNVPTQCQSGIGATGFDAGTKAEYDVVMRLWNVEFRADIHRANQFIDNVTSTVLSAQPSVTVDSNAFIGCRFVGMVDGATRAISDIVRNQIVACANEGLNIGTDLAKFNCSLTKALGAQMVAGQVAYATIDIECSVNVNLGCRSGFDQYLRDASSSTCSTLANNSELATFIKNTSCNIR